MFKFYLIFGLAYYLIACIVSVVVAFHQPCQLVQLSVFSLKEILANGFLTHPRFSFSVIFEVNGVHLRWDLALAIDRCQVNVFCKTCRIAVGVHIQVFQLFNLTDLYFDGVLKSDRVIQVEYLNFVNNGKKFGNDALDFLFFFFKSIKFSF